MQIQEKFRTSFSFISDNSARDLIPQIEDMRLIVTIMAANKEAAGDIMFEIWKADRMNIIFQLFNEAKLISNIDRGLTNHFNKAGVILFNRERLVNIIRDTVKRGIQKIGKSEFLGDQSDLLMFLYDCCEVQYRYDNNLYWNTPISEVQQKDIKTIFIGQLITFTTANRQLVQEYPELFKQSPIPEN